MQSMRHRLRTYPSFGVAMGGESPRREFCTNDCAERLLHARQVRDGSQIVATFFIATATAAAVRGHPILCCAGPRIETHVAWHGGRQ